VSVVGRYSKEMSNTSPPGTVFYQKQFVICPMQSGLRTSLSADGCHLLRRAANPNADEARHAVVLGKILDFHFIEGAPFTAADDARPSVAVITDGASRQSPRQRPRGWTETINLGGQAYRVQ